ncbi:MAG: hypothetical protein JOZ08_25360 [Verrucomicrobia bacterium]|nr:hypothetical protein [Verrucomicrobiota bacterium]
MLQKRNERGAALIVAVSVVGLAFVVSVGAFLLAGSLNQDTARVVSSKIDIASREETLVRAIVQQTALGIQPNNNYSWTTIMTNAVNQVLATAYVDPAQVTQIFGANSPIVVNAGDTGGASLGIFQGYSNSAVPFGGTSGVASLLQAYDGTVEPPTLSWVGNTLIDAGTAATNPLQFFLGSQTSSTGSASTSPTGRWSQLTYPNIRFGFMQPGDAMVARRVWWRIPVDFQTTEQTQEQIAAGLNGIYRYPAAPVNYILSVYEIPSQLPITGNANIQLGLYSDSSSWGNTTSSTNPVYIASSSSSSGSIYGDTVQLQGGTYNGGIGSKWNTNVGASTSVAGQTYANNTFDDLGVREVSDLTRTAGAGAAPVSIAGDDGKVVLLPILPGLPFYDPASGVPAAWDLYARPYYHSRVRITISGTNSNLNYSGGVINTTGTAGSITVTISYLPDAFGQPDAMFGVLDSAIGWTTCTYQQTSNASGGGHLVRSDGSPCDFLLYTSTSTGVAGQDQNILEIDLKNMFAASGLSILGLSQSQCYSIYISAPAASNTNNTAYAQDTAYANVGVTITDCDDLGLFTNGLSIVSPQRLYLTGNFNNGGSGNNGTTGVKVATSVYTPELRYGIDGLPSQIALAGQISISQATQQSATAVNPLAFVNGANSPMVGTGNSYKLNAITNPRQVPPITRLNLLFTIEKERPN